MAQDALDPEIIEMLVKRVMNPDSRRIFEQHFDHVQVRDLPDGGVIAEPVWKGVDIPIDGGMVLKAEEREHLPRLIKVIESGAIFKEIDLIRSRDHRGKVLEALEVREVLDGAHRDPLRAKTSIMMVSRIGIPTYLVRALDYLLYIEGLE